MARVYVSSVISAPADKVWERVRDFNGLPKWHPRIRDSRIEDAEPADKVGCIRNFNLQNGDNIREQLLGLSDYDMFCTYSILESPMPLTDYITGIYTAFGICMALIHKDRTGEGQMIDANLMESSFSLMEQFVPAFDQLGFVANRAGTR